MTVRLVLAAHGLAAVAAACSQPVAADPDEAWIRRADVAAEVAPLLVLLLDTSADMSAEVIVPEPYDPARPYEGDCSPDRVYWRRGAGPVPDCRGTSSVPLAGRDALTGWRCEAGSIPLATAGFYVASRVAQWERRAGGGYWRELRSGDDGAVECRVDRGLHGSSSGRWFAVEEAATPWAEEEGREIRWDAPPLSDPHVFFSGNYLNYRAATPPTRNVTLHDWVALQLAAATGAVDELDLAIARLSHDGGVGDAAGEGGMVALTDTSLPAGSGRIAALVRDWPAAGPAPLGEAVAEVGAWLAGEPVDYGLASSSAPGVALPSVPDSRLPDEPTRYRSPFNDACRAVTLGLLTTATPSADDGAVAAAARLPGFDPADCASGCLPGLARWLATHDLRASLPGRQLTATRILSPTPRAPLAAAIGRAAGADPQDLRDPLAVPMLLAEALGHDAASALILPPRVSQPAHLAPEGAVYFGLSDPRHAPRWRGNLRRYRLAPPDGTLREPTVVDRDDEPAFDAATGAPDPDSRSAWSEAPDGTAAALGGAAGRLPEPARRLAFSNLEEGPLTAASNRIVADNPLLTRDALGLTPADPRTVDELVGWLLGRDSFDADHDGDLESPRHDLGDPGLRAPLLLRYAGGQTLAFLVTADGSLHAFDAASGAERWSFTPAALLGRTAARAAARTTAVRVPGGPGGMAIAARDIDGDRAIDPGLGEWARLLFGVGGQGTGYYALDVSRPDEPRLLWSRQAPDLPGFAESWPEPVLARMNIDPDRQSASRLVAVLTGGYDPAERIGELREAEPGAALAIVDAETGNLLWLASGGGPEPASVAPAAMRYSFPSAPRVIDSDGDGFADLLYAVDFAGQLWRVDAPHAAVERPILTIRRTADLSDPAGLARRRFFHTPDVVLEPIGGLQRLVVAFGSGRVSRPRETETQDRLYAVFDEPAAGREEAVPVLEADLEDVTDASTGLPSGARGWKRRLDAHGPGEKVAGAASTFDHRLRFTTHQPVGASPDAPCGPPAARNRLYTLDVRHGRAVNHVGDEPVPSEELPIAGLPPPLRVVLPFPGDGGCATPGCLAPVLLVGGLGEVIDFRNRPVKTSWRQLDAPPD